MPVAIRPRGTLGPAADQVPLHTNATAAAASSSIAPASLFILAAIGRRRGGIARVGNWHGVSTLAGVGLCWVSNGLNWLCLSDVGLSNIVLSAVWLRWVGNALRRIRDGLDDRLCYRLRNLHLRLAAHMMLRLHARARGRGDGHVRGGPDMLAFGAVALREEALLRTAHDGDAEEEADPAEGDQRVLMGLSHLGAAV